MCINTESEASRLSEARATAEVLIEMIRNMTPAEQERILYLIQGVKVGEKINEQRRV